MVELKVPMITIESIAVALQERLGVLEICDIKLEYVGIFDIVNNWHTLHRSHRIGKNADIGFKGIK